MAIRLAENIKNLRESHMITQSELADALSVTPQSVSRWENGLAYPDIEKLPDIASFFNVTIDELIGTSSKRIVVLFDKARELRDSLRDEYSDEKMIKLCDVLEKLLYEGDEHFLGEYFVNKLRLFRNGIIDSDQMEEARDVCRKTLSTLKGQRLLHVLAAIVSNEDDENKPRWREFVTEDNYVSDWNDVLLMSHQINKSNKWEEQRQLVMYENIKKLVHMLSYIPFNMPVSEDDKERAYKNSKAACKIISAFSESADDIFLAPRINTEFAFAKACFECGRNEEGFAALENVRRNLLILEQIYINSSELNGSEKTFDLHKTKINDFAFFNAVEVMYPGNSCFDNIRKDQRFIDFSELISKLGNSRRDDDFSMLADTESSVFRELHQCAEQLIKTNKPTSEYTQAIVLLSRKGNIYKQIIGNTIGDDETDERNLIKLLKKNDDTRISKMVAMWFNDYCIDVASHRLRKKLCDLNRENVNTRMLVNGRDAYITYTVGQTLSKYDRLRYEN